MFKEELIIIRHARNRHNIRLTEDLDAELTAFGHKQAANVGKFLAKHMNLADFRLYTSPLLRTLQTAEPIGQALKKHCVVEELAREYINHGGREIRVPTRQKEFPYPAFHWGAFPDEGVSYKDEFNEEFIARMHKLYDKLSPKSVIITHGLPALQLLHIAINPRMNYIPLWDHSLDNCSMSYIVNGRLLWHGRNLPHECEHDPFEVRRAYDATDMIRK